MQTLRRLFRNKSAGSPEQAHEQVREQVREHMRPTLPPRSDAKSPVHQTSVPMSALQTIPEPTLPRVGSPVGEVVGEVMAASAPPTPIQEVTGLSTTPGIYLYQFDHVLELARKTTKGVEQVVFAFEEQGAQYTMPAEELAEVTILKFGMTRSLRTRAYGHLNPTLLCFVPLPTTVMREAERAIETYCVENQLVLKEAVRGKQSEGIYVKNKTVLRHLMREFTNLQQHYMDRCNIPYLVLANRYAHQLEVARMALSETPRPPRKQRSRRSRSIQHVPETKPEETESTPDA